ncbi:MAG TPA: pentapeptide repeat-containing protein, partial [Phormidium sp.]
MSQQQQQIAQKSQTKLQEMIDKANRCKEQDFSYQDMTRIDLTRQFLEGSKFIHAKLSGANLARTNLNNCDCSYADFSGANLNDGWLRESNLTGANLSFADLSENLIGKTNFTNANLSHVNFENAVFIDDCIWDGANLTGAHYGFYDTGSHEEKIFMTKPPVVLFGKTQGGHGYKVMIFDKYIKIGCQLRSYKEWLEM